MHLPSRGWPTQIIAGANGSITSLAVVPTIGLLAFAPLGSVAPEVGVPAAFTASAVGGLAMAVISASALPTAGPSSATALILAGFVAKVVAQEQAPSVAVVPLVVALAAASIVVMGLLQMLFGALRLGSVSKFVPQPALAGFMNGVAILILWSQFPALLGIASADLQRDGWHALAHAQPATVAIGILTAAVCWLIVKRAPRAPASLIGLVVGCGAYFGVTALVPSMPVGPQVGPLPQVNLLPHALLPLATASLIDKYAADIVLTGVLLALIGALESILSMLAMDRAMETRTRVDRELIALGASNVVSGVFGGVPLVYLRARAIATLTAGGRSRLAAGSGSVLLGLLLVFGGTLLAKLPLTVLAGIMVVLAFLLMDGWTRQLVDHWRQGIHLDEARRNLLIVAAVCATTLVFGFLSGVVLGVVLSMLEFARSMSASLIRSSTSGLRRRSRRLYPTRLEARLADLRSRISVLELEGALYFGSVATLAAEVERIQPRPSHLVIDLAKVTTLDATGALMISQMSRQLKHGGVRLFLAGVSKDTRHGLTLLAHDALTTDVDWSVDVDRALERAERQLLEDEGSQLDESVVALASCDLLVGLSAEHVARLNSVMIERRLRAGEVLFRKGDPGTALFVLTSGSISIVNDSVRYLSFSPGMTFGELAVLDGSGRSADAIADTDATVRELPIDEIRRIEDGDPLLISRLYRNLASHLSARLRGATSQPV